MSVKERYQLRKAAGMYWLLDMEQGNPEGKGTVAFNECGAHIWERYKEGCTMDEIAETLHEAYGVPAEEAKADAAAFLKDIKGQGIHLEI